MPSAGELLLRGGLCTPAELTLAHAAREREKGTLGYHLVRLGLVPEDRLAEFYRHRLMVPRMPRAALERIARAVIDRVPRDMAAELRVLPVELDREGNLTLVMSDPADTHAVDEIAFFTGHYVMRAVAIESDIEWALAKYYGFVRAQTPVSVPAIGRAEPTPPYGPILLTNRKQSPAPPAEESAEEPILLDRPKSIAGEHETVAALRKADDRDSIGALLLDFFARLHRRAALLVVRKGTIAAQDARGDVDPKALAAATLPVQEPSVVREVLATQVGYRGPLPDDASSAPLFALCGGPPAGDVVLWPIRIGDRVIALLYADEPSMPIPDGLFDRLACEAGAAYERLVRAAKR
jgi:hypothetical protein